LTHTRPSRIFASINLAEVHHAKNLLDSVGIRSFVKNEALASAVGQLPFTDCQPELWLSDSADAERARRVLSEGVLSPAEKGNVWQCACGEIQEAQFTQCWRCGEFRQG
jgi:hypothetical protein